MPYSRILAQEVAQSIRIPKCLCWFISFSLSLFLLHVALSQWLKIATKDLLAEHPISLFCFALFLTSMVIRTQSISPILTLYIRSMGTDNLIFVSDLCVSYRLLVFYFLVILEVGDRLVTTVS